MSTFICDKCGCVDNSACGGTYWSSKSGWLDLFEDDYFNTNPVCCACAPDTYGDGSKNSKAGKWHGLFERKHWSEFGDVNKLLELEKADVGDMVNATEYFEKRGMIEKVKSNSGKIKYIKVLSETEPENFESATKKW